jgi:heavy metal translocating P-type ATPase
MSSLAREPRVCHYCQSPLPSGWRAAQEGAGERDTADVYCCLGCRFAAAIIQDKGESGVAREMLTRLGLSIFFTMNVMAFTMALWTTDVYEAAETANQLSVTLNGLFRYVVLLFSIPVLILLGIPLFTSTWENARRGIVSTDALLSLGVGAAFALSSLAVLRGTGPIYFEVGCVILVMTTLGRWLEATGRLKASSALDALAKLLPASVRRLESHAELEQERLVPIEQITVGDLLRILPGERFPTDGQVERNSALVDEQVLTGESRPVLKERGARILGGTLNLDGDLVVKVNAVGDQCSLARLVELVRHARLTKGRYQRLVDHISAWFFPAMASVAALTFGVHWILGSLGQGLMAALAVSLIACPCALGLATPLAVWSAIGQAASHQVLFRGGEALERLAGIRAIRFDKTGTLSTGKPTIQTCLFEDPADAENALLRAVALGASTSHALSTAIVEYQAANQASRPGPAREVRVVPGRGVVGTLDDAEAPISLGSPLLMEERGLRFGPVMREALERHKTRGLSLAAVGWAGEVRGLFVFAENWRPEVKDVILRLLAAGLDVGILTGDHDARGQAVARDLGVSVLAELLPDDKVAAIRRARQDHGPVAMVGDGVNDAPALAASDVGIALSCGTDVSRDSAAICLLGDDLSRIPWTIDLARRTIGVIRQNLIWSFGYNLVGVFAAALGVLNPAVAAFLMVVSSALVIGNSLRLRQPDRSALPAEHAPNPATDRFAGVLTRVHPVALEAAPR